MERCRGRVKTSDTSKKQIVNLRGTNQSNFQKTKSKLFKKQKWSTQGGTGNKFMGRWGQSRTEKVCNIKRFQRKTGKNFNKSHVYSPEAQSVYFNN